LCDWFGAWTPSHAAFYEVSARGRHCIAVCSVCCKHTRRTPAHILTHTRSLLVTHPFTHSLSQHLTQPLSHPLTFPPSLPFSAALCSRPTLLSSCLPNLLSFLHPSLHPSIHARTQHLLITYH